MKKTKIKIEYDMKSTPVALLWNYISSAAGLAKWFAEDVEIEGKDYIFYWDKLPQTAHLTAMRNLSHLRLRWDDEGDPSMAHTYFEMRIAENDMTGNTSLQITDFADEGDEDALKDLWRAQVDELRRNIGC